MNTHWIHTVPGSLIIAAFVAWPMSRQDSANVHERIRFCLLSMLGFALLVWGFQQPPTGFHGSLGVFTVNGFVVAMMATVFLALLWFPRVADMMTETLLGFTDFPNDDQADLKYETRQIEEAVQLFRRGKRRRALRLCNRIIQSNSQYTSTATTLAFWIENPGRLEFARHPRAKLKFKGRFSD